MCICVSEKENRQMLTIAENGVLMTGVTTKPLEPSEAAQTASWLLGRLWSNDWFAVHVRSIIQDVVRCAREKYYSGGGLPFRTWRSLPVAASNTRAVASSLPDTMHVCVIAGLELV